MGSGRRAPIIRTRASSEEGSGMPPKVVLLVAVVMDRRIGFFTPQDERVAKEGTSSF
jgi:hypothetical protein